MGLILGVGVCGNAHADEYRGMLFSPRFEATKSTDEQPESWDCYTTFGGNFIFDGTNSEKLKKSLDGKTIKELHLRLSAEEDAAVDLKSIGCFLKLLPEFTNLESFFLTVGNAESAQLILENLSLLPASLSWLSLKFKGFEEENIVKLSEVLAHFSGLKRVDINADSLTTTSDLLLAKAFAKLPPSSIFRLWIDNEEYGNLIGSSEDEDAKIERLKILMGLMLSVKRKK